MGSAMATSNWIRCPQCDGDVLIAAEYVTKSTVRAPALKCARCNTLHLDEAVARSPAERESVRMAKAERAAVSASDSNLPAEPQTFEGPDRHSNTFEVVADRLGQPGGRVLLVDDEDIVRAGHGQARGGVDRSGRSSPSPRQASERHRCSQSPGALGARHSGPQRTCPRWQRRQAKKIALHHAHARLIVAPALASAPERALGRICPIHVADRTCGYRGGGRP